MDRSSKLIWQDTQHNMLFKLIDELAEDTCHEHVIQHLKLYADHHFLLEEAYMERLDYPKREAHIAAHNRFRTELKQLEFDYQNSGTTLALRKTISAFLNEWLTRHILAIDKEFEEFVLQSERK